MRLVLAAALIAVPVLTALTLPVSAQKSRYIPQQSDEIERHAKKVQKERQEADKAYRDTIKQVPEQKAVDPWAKMR